MSAKPTPDREMILARIARALGCAGYSVEECDAIMGWVQAAHPAVGRGASCAACGGRGRVPPVPPDDILSGLNGAEEETLLAIQGICLACRGRGFIT